MAQTPEDGTDESKLELPSLSIFRRGKKKSAAEESSDEPAPDETLAEAPGTPSVAPSTEPEDSPETHTEPLAELGSEADEPDVEEPSVEDPGVEEPDVQEPAVQVASEPEVAAETSVEAEAPPADTAIGTMFPNAVAEQDQDQDRDDTDDPEDDTEVLPVAEPEAVVGHPAQVDQVGEDESPHSDEGDQGTPWKRRRELTLPRVNAKVAALVTGALVGLVGVVLTFVTQKGCEAVKGTGSCGGIGLLLLIVILVAMVLLGAALLKAWKISDPTSSSFLAVGLVAVVAMLFFLSIIDRWYMVIVIPVLSALTYLLSWWVTATFIETPENETPDNQTRDNQTADNQTADNEA
jgi:hypothetical protein